MNELYDDDRIPAAFEQFSEGYNRLYDRPYAIELAAVTAGTRVLDVGCGPGLHLAELTARGGAAVGLDSSAPMLQHARRKVGDATFVRASIDARLPFATGSFDVVVCASAINYAADVGAVLAEFRRVVRDNGAVVISTRHPMTDFMRKGGSYYDVILETDEFGVAGRGRWHEQFWRRPLSHLCEAAFRAGLLIERLVEPVPLTEMSRTAPDHYKFLLTRPTFVVLRLLPAPR